jgi:hypothetical protein
MNSPFFSSLFGVGIGIENISVNPDDGYDDGQNQ